MMFSLMPVLNLKKAHPDSLMPQPSSQFTKQTSRPIHFSGKPSTCILKTWSATLSLWLPEIFIITRPESLGLIKKPMERHGEQTSLTDLPATDPLTGKTSQRSAELSQGSSTARL